MDSLLHGLRALGDAKRLQMIRLLAGGDYCVGCLAERLGISASATSQHLKVLREVGFVRGEKRGYWTHYQLETAQLNRWFADLSHWNKDLEAEVKAPCPNRGGCKRRHQT